MADALSVSAGGLPSSTVSQLSWFPTVSLQAALPLRARAIRQLPGPRLSSFYRSAYLALADPFLARLLPLLNIRLG